MNRDNTLLPPTFDCRRGMLSPAISFPSRGWSSHVEPTPHRVRCCTWMLACCRTGLLRRIHARFDYGVSAVHNSVSAVLSVRASLWFRLPAATILRCISARSWIREPGSELLPAAAAVPPAPPATATIPSASTATLATPSFHARLRRGIRCHADHNDRCHRKRANRSVPVSLHADSV